jgi:DNA polymerase III subunit delta
VAKDFIVRDRGRVWQADMTYAQFKGEPLKAVLADDGVLADLVRSWNEMLSPPSGGRKGTAAASDLVMARNPRSPFPVFQTLKKADRFSHAALCAAMLDLSATDRKMKSTGQDPRLLLEAFLMRLCAGRQT